MGTVDVKIEGLTSAKGVVQLVICAPDGGFPDCKDRAVRSATLPIRNKAATAHFSGLTPGEYAIAVFHDANGNGKLDTFLGIPQEGFGFSRNPSLKPRAPRFGEARIEVQDRADVAIRMKYLF